MRSPNFSRTGQLSSCFSWEILWDAGPYYQRVSELFEKAENRILIAGWQLDSRLVLSTDGEALRAKLLRLVDNRPELHVGCLLWDHAYFYSFERENWQARIWEDIHPRIHLVFDNLAPFGGSHHEKMILIDDEVALLGGVDLCKARWDSVYHHPRDPRRKKHGFSKSDLPHHDLGVQVTGPIVADLAQQIRRRWERVSRIPFQEVAKKKPHSVPENLQKVLRSRTEVLPAQWDPERGKRKGGRIVREIEHSYRWLIAQAQDHIVIENQYYWSGEIQSLLLQKLRESPQVKLTLILPVPSLYPGLSRLMEFHELELLDELARLDNPQKDRVQIYFPVSDPEEAGQTRCPIYIHSKAMIIDDHFATIGSANCASRSLRVDTETNLTFIAETPGQRQKIHALREHIFQHWNLHKPEASLHLIRVSPGHAKAYNQQSMRWVYQLGQVRLWKKLMDPNFPLRWGCLGNRQRSRFASAPVTNGVLVGALVWVLQSLLVTFLSYHPDYGRRENQILFIHALAFQTLWFARFPVIAGLILAGLALPTIYAARLTVLSIWINSLTILIICNFFPFLASALYRGASAQLIRFQFRRLPGFISTFLDPRISIRSKLIDQARAALPFPWILLGSLSLLPAMLYFGSYFVSELCPPSWKASLSPFAVITTLGLTFWSIQDFWLGTLLRKKHSRSRDGRN